MADEKKDAAGADEPKKDAKKDANEEIPAWADSLGKRFDAFEKRMDALEGKDAKKDDAEDSKKKDAKKDEGDTDKDTDREDAKKDAKKDESDAEDEKRRKASEAKADSALAENAALKQQLEALSARMSVMGRELTIDERNEVAKLHARADSVARLFGEQAPRELLGETPRAYARRLAQRFQKHANSLKDIKLDSLDDAVFPVIEAQIYEAAKKSGLDPATAPKGRFYEEVRVDELTGARTIIPHGDSGTWLDQMRGVDRFSVRVNSTNKGA